MANDFVVFLSTGILIVESEKKNNRQAWKFNNVLSSNKFVRTAESLLFVSFEFASAKVEWNDTYNLFFEANVDT